MVRSQASDRFFSPFVWAAAVVILWACSPAGNTTAVQSATTEMLTALSGKDLRAFRAHYEAHISPGYAAGGETASQYQARLEQNLFASTSSTYTKVSESIRASGQGAWIDDLTVKKASVTPASDTGTVTVTTQAVVELQWTFISSPSGLQLTADRIASRSVQMVAGDPSLQPSISSLAFTPTATGGVLSASAFLPAVPGASSCSAGLNYERAPIDARPANASCSVGPGWNSIQVAVTPSGETPLGPMAAHVGIVVYAPDQTTVLAMAGSSFDLAEAE